MNTNANLQHFFELINQEQWEQAQTFWDENEWDDEAKQQRLAFCQQKAETMPEKAEVHFVLGKSLAVVRDNEQALAAYSKAVELEPNEIRYHHARNIYYRLCLSFRFSRQMQGKSIAQEDKILDIAIPNISKTIELQPENADNYSSRAFVYDKQEQYDLALADYNKAIELQPEKAAHYSSRASVYDKQEKYDLALADYSKAIELIPEGAGNYLFRADVYKNQEKYDLALADLTKFVELVPPYMSSEELYCLRAWVYQAQEKYDLAIADLSKAIELKPENANNYSSRASVYDKQEKYDLALADYSKCIELKPENANSYFLRAWLYGKQEKYDLALADCSKRIELEPENADSYLLRALLYKEQKQYDLALAEANYLIKTFPNSCYGYVAKLDFLLGKKQYDPAAEVVKLAENAAFTVKNDTDNMHKQMFMALKAQFYLVTDEPQQAIDTLKQIQQCLAHLPEEFKKAAQLSNNAERLNPTSYLTDYFLHEKCTLPLFAESLITLFDCANNDSIARKIRHMGKTWQSFLASETLQTQAEYTFYSIFDKYKFYQKTFAQKQEKGVELLILRIKIDVLVEFLQLPFENKQATSLLAAIHSSVIQKYEDLLEAEEKQTKKLQEKLKKMVQQYTHSLANNLLPNTIYNVAQRLKKHTSFRKEALILSDAYHAEMFMKTQGQMLHIRNGENAKTFQAYIRGDRLELDAAEGISVAEILQKAAERVLARFLNEDYHKIDSVRQIVLQRYDISLEALKQKFEEEVFFAENSDVIGWINQNFESIHCEMSALWQQLRFRREGYTDALLQGYFSELLFNALKYRDAEQPVWQKIAFTETELEEQPFLTCCWSNPYRPHHNISISTHKGLESIQNDLEMLNETEDQAQTLNIQTAGTDFAVNLYFRKDLLAPSPKRKINFDQFTQ